MTIEHNPSSKDSQEATAFDAIATVSDAAIERDAAIKRAEAMERDALEKTKWHWRLFVLLIAIVVPAVWAAYFWSYSLPPLEKLPVAVLLPHTEEGKPAWDNAVRQKQGFDEAFEANSAALGDVNKPHVIHFDFGIFAAGDDESKETEAIRVLREIQSLYYADKGVRVFLITMSGAVKEIKPKFVAWAKDLDPRDRPTLIATVASAPGIADQKNGVLRHYIRSEDESDVLSTYIESLKPTPKVVGVFYVDDPYGEKAMESLSKRLDHDGFRPYKTAIVPKEGDVAAEVRKFIERQNSNGESLDNSAVAVIVGYGEMIRRTLLSLRDVTAPSEERSTRFDGPILVVSTFTEKIWRPTSLSNDFAERIHTVGPGRVARDPDKIGVVFQFSYMTLDRVIRCRDERGPERFWNCWNSSETTKKIDESKRWADVEFTANGDSRVSLKLLNHEQWSSE